jgi:hypothetical protein
MTRHMKKGRSLLARLNDVTPLCKPTEVGSGTTVRRATTTTMLRAVRRVAVAVADGTIRPTLKILCLPSHQRRANAPRAPRRIDGRERRMRTLCLQNRMSARRRRSRGGRVGLVMTRAPLSPKTQKEVYMARGSRPLMHQRNPAEHKMMIFSIMSFDRAGGMVR